ncbi:hypothetical protein QX776_12500 [Alteromonadaceae bacterium BrNp21-10]|nr:hypothetical protein [Alteromonadaceae bacterium BrNp21-10]
MSLSTYRIYLDDDNRSASFVMYNKKVVKEECELTLVHKSWSENGTMTDLAEDVIPETSAEPWIRFSPKNFVANERVTQTVRFTLRRKANMEPAEYRSYLKVFCDAVEEELPSSNSANGKTAKITVKPRLVQHVPIVVRIGKLDVQLAFSNFKIDGNTVHFDISRQGNRSVYGKIELVDKSSNEVISSKKNISIYTDSTQVSYDMNRKDVPVNQLAVRFVEDKNYGGTLTLQQDFTVN